METVATADGIDIAGLTTSRKARQGYEQKRSRILCDISTAETSAKFTRQAWAGNITSPAINQKSSAKIVNDKFENKLEEQCLNTEITCRKCLTAPF